MSKSIAERALVAHEAQQEERRLRQEAEIVRLRADAVNSILVAAERFDLEIDADDIEPAVCSASVTSPFIARWWITVPIDDDLDLKIEFNPRGEDKVAVTAEYPDQLYWDLPPGQEKKRPGGGTYGCYSLDKSHGGGTVRNLAELGREIVRTRKARAAWRAKWET